MKFKLLLVSGLLLSICLLSCKTSFHLSIPAQFSENATQMPVQGVGKKYMSFGHYQTSKVKRGWNPGSSGRAGNFAQRFIEDRLYSDFGVSVNTIKTKDKKKFQYDLISPNGQATIFGQEKKLTSEVRIKAANQFEILNNISLPKDYKYHFQTAIFPDQSQYKEPWKLLVTYNHNALSDSASKLFEMPGANEHGYATDGKDSIFIKAIYTNKAQNKKGKDVKMLIKMLVGYELRWEDGVVCVIDAVKKNVWIYNELEEKEKFIVAAIASALMLRRVQDFRN